MIISSYTLRPTQQFLKFAFDYGFNPDHLKTKKMCKHAVKKLPFIIRS